MAAHTRHFKVKKYNLHPRFANTKDGNSRYLLPWKTRPSSGTRYIRNALIYIVLIASKWSVLTVFI